MKFFKTYNYVPIFFQVDSRYNVVHNWVNRMPFTYDHYSYSNSD